MREPRPGLGWSRRRVQRRAEYSTWMASPEWQARRAAWQERWVATHGIAPVCQICESPWSLRRGDLHHRSYARLGHETDRELLPLCRGCHQLLHAVLESNRGWLRTGRAAATDAIVARLRAKKRESCEPQPQ